VPHLSSANLHIGHNRLHGPEVSPIHDS
jgi:hypothetical protein